MGRVSSNITHYPAEAITTAFIRLLVREKLYDETYTVNESGLLALYHRTGVEKFNCFNDIWLIYNGPDPVGIAAISHIGENRFSLYVLPKYRNRGYASALVSHVLNHTTDFVVCYTPAAHPLYTHWQLTYAEGCEPPPSDSTLPAWKRTGNP